MKKLLPVVWLFILILTTFNNAFASDVVINGYSQFDCSLSDKFMEKHGYVFIEESYYKDFLTTNMYGAKDAEVIVENEHGAVLGTGLTDSEGKFSITVPMGDLYKIIVRFRDRESIKQIEFPKIENVIIYMGYVTSDTIDSWIRTAARTD